MDITNHLYKDALKPRPQQQHVARNCLMDVDPGNDTLNNPNLSVLFNV